jgi:hypothetical protein
MAARENQGLQIALIIFVMLTIVLIVTTYMFFRSYSDERDRAKSLSDQKSTAEQATQKAIADFEQFRGLIGAATTDSVDVVAEAAKKDMAHGEGLPESKQNYRGLVEHLVAKLRKYEATNADLAAQVKDLNTKLDTNLEAAKAEVEKFSQQLDAVAADLEKERETFKADRGDINKQKDQLAANSDATRKEHEKLVQKSNDQISALAAQLQRTNQLLTDLRAKAEREEKAQEFPDGKIVRVNQRTRTAWLNVGPADGLRLQTSFVIVAPEDGNPIKSQPKGIIEVVRLTGPHEAEARIVDDDLSNPIMVGDNIFSAVWETGRPERFALAGKMDLDGDGESDRAVLREVISMNGGIIDAEVAEDGTRTGEMSVNVKYLVLGDKPGPDSKDLTGYSEIFQEAQTLGVKWINVQEFLDYVGYKDEHRAVQFGRGAKASDFKPRLPDGRQRIVPGSAPPKDVRKPHVPTP